MSGNIFSVSVSANGCQYLCRSAAYIIGCRQIRRQLQRGTRPQTAETRSLDSKLLAPSSHLLKEEHNWSTEHHDQTRARISTGETEEMSDARFQRVNGFSRSSLRLMSKQCTSDLAVVGRKASHHASHTSAQLTASSRMSGGRSGCFPDGSNTFPGQTGPGGRSKVLGQITEDDEARDKKPNLEQFALETPAKTALTKTISFLASPKKRTLRANKTKKTGAEKRPSRSLYKEPVATRSKKPYWQDTSNGKLKGNKRTFKHVTDYKSPICNRSDSSKLSEPIRAIAQKSRSGATPPHLSRKRMTVTSQAVCPKWPQQKVKRSISIKRRTYLHPVSPSKVVKTQSSQNCYFISFSVSPQKVFCQTNDTTTSPRLEDLGPYASLPHRCVGYENLFNADSKIKSNGSLNKRRALSKQKLKSKNRGKMKVQGSEEVSGYRGQSRYSLEKRSEAGSGNNGGLVDTGQPRDSQLVGNSKLSIRSVPCETHSIQNIFRNSALVFLGDEKKSKKTHKTATAKPKIKLFSRNRVEGSKQQSDFGHFIYRQKLPSVSDYTPLRPKSSKKCAFTTESSPQMTTARKRGNDKNVIKNTIKNTVPRSATIKNRIFSERPMDESCVKMKLIYKKTKSGILRPLQQKIVKNKDKSKLTVTNADSRKENKDSLPGRHINIWKKRPRTTICHYRNKEKHTRYPDSCSSSEVNLPNSKTSRCIPETPSPEMAVCAVRKVYSERIWDRYDNSQEPMSSFFRQVSTCDSSAGTQQVALLKGMFRLPSGTVSCSEENCSMFQEPCLQNTQICIPSLTDDPSIPPTHSSCCAVALFPSLFGFLNSINKTLSAPLFNRTSFNTVTYQNSRETQPLNCTLERLPFTNDEKLNEIQGTRSQEESNYIKHETGEKQICAGDRHSELVERTLMDDKNMADLEIELNKTQVKDQDSNLSLSQLSECSRATKRRTLKKFLLMSSTTDVVKSILHMGNISTAKKTQEYGRKQNVQPPPKENVLEEKDSYCQSEESETKNKDSTTVVKWDNNWKLLILGLICFTTVVQVILYYLIPRR